MKTLTFKQWVVEDLQTTDHDFIVSYRSPTEFLYHGEVFGIGKFYVAFGEMARMPGVWSREYDSESGVFDELNSTSPRKILRAITDVTINFISEITPDALVIHHIPMDNEMKKGYVDTPNKRARANKPYLSSIQGYTLKQYNKLTNFDRATFSVLYRQGTVDPIEAVKIIEPFHKVKEVN